MVLFNSTGKKLAWFAALVFACAGLACFAVINSSSPAHAAVKDGTMLYRIYNPNSGEHFYTADKDERTELCGAKRHGWSYEGVAWVSPNGGDPVYRLYNPNAGDHHYTMSESERDALVAAGWSYEKVGWYSDPGQTAPLYRDYNPNQFAWNHNYTADEAEHSYLVSLGWNDEGVGWYGSSAPAAIVFDNSTFRSTLSDTYAGRASGAVALSELVSGLDGPRSPEEMVDFLVPKSNVAPRTNVACTMNYGAPKLGSTAYPVPSGVSSNCATFFIWTDSKSGYLSVELDDEGMIYPDATANCYSFS